MVGTLELRAVPDRLAALVSRQLARHLDRLPVDAASDGQPFGLALAQRHPHRLPAAELANPTWPLRQREEKAFAQCTFGSLCTNAPSAERRKTSTRPTAPAEPPSPPPSRAAGMRPATTPARMRGPRAPS